MINHWRENFSIEKFELTESDIEYKKYWKFINSKENRKFNITHQIYVSVHIGWHLECFNSVFWNECHKRITK